MSIVLPGNLEYLGPEPNFSRDSYDTLEELQGALAEGHIDEGHLSYCKETKTTYQALPGPAGDLYWVNPWNRVKEEILEELVKTEKVIAASLWELHEEIQEWKTRTS